MTDSRNGSKCNVERCSLFLERKTGDKPLQHERELTTMNRTQASAVKGKRSNTASSLLPSISNVKERQGWNQGTLYLLHNLMEDIPRPCHLSKCRDQET